MKTGQEMIPQMQADFVTLCMVLWPGPLNFKFFYRTPRRPPQSGSELWSRRRRLERLNQCTKFTVVRLCGLMSTAGYVGDITRPYTTQSPNVALICAARRSKCERCKPPISRRAGRHNGQRGTLELENENERSTATQQGRNAAICQCT